MFELVKFFIAAGIIVGIMYGVEYLCRVAATRLNVNVRALTWIVVIIIFLACSYLWVYTDAYERLSRVTGIPLAK
jgi:hypothetical protein